MPVWGVICIYACSEVCVCLFVLLFVFMPVLRFVYACLGSYSPEVSAVLMYNVNYYHDSCFAYDFVHIALCHVIW